MKNIFLAILFVLFAILALYLTIYRKGTSLNKTEKIFALSNSKEINCIKIVNNEDGITLLKGSGKWSIDNKEVRDDLINTLLGVSEGLDAISPVSGKDCDSVLYWLDKGTKIAFYDNNRIINSFRICKQNNTIYGVLEGSHNPYKLSLRGFPDIDLIKIYSAKAEHWKMNVLINFDPSAIKSIILEYSLKPENSFQLEKKDDGQFYLSKSGRFSALQNTDPEILAEYLSFFSDIKYYPVNDSAGTKKEITGTQKPFFHLRILTVNDTITEIWGYNKPNLENDDSDAYEFYAISQEKGIIVLKYNDFDPILVNIDYFLKK
jgi:hypothetical protein